MPRYFGEAPLMNDKTMLDIINQNIEEYLRKTRSFNDIPTVLLCSSEEKDSIVERGREFNITFDKIDTNVDLMDSIKCYGNSVNYFISDTLINDDIYRSLIGLGIELEHIFIGFTKTDYFDLYSRRNVVFENIDKITRVYNLLVDEKSKRTFLKIIVRLCLPYQFHYYYETEDFIQYYPTFFTFSDHEIYLDGGVCEGKNIRQFIDKVGGNYQYIFGVEADPTNYAYCQKELKNIPNMQMYNLALHSEECELSFFSSKKTGKRGNAHVQPGGDVVVKTVVGDNLSLAPSYIKLDIEGSEKDALLGLKNTIKEAGPKLSICVYHFQSDFWEVPLLMHKLNPSYRLSIRNHEKMKTLLETVCYGYIEQGE